MHGLLVIDKPAGITSRDAVNRLQRTLPRGTKVGHTGTLDPLATGVLVVCLGQATRLADDVQAMGKSYTTTVRLGATSTSDDADGEVTPWPDATAPERGAIEALCAGMVGHVAQVPPVVSALKIDGRRAHELARLGAEVPVRPRTVHIKAITLIRYEWPSLELSVDCGKGTYIRSIARELGVALGCGGLVQVLRRTSVGPFGVEQAVGVDANLEEICTRLRPPRDAVAHLPRLDVSEADAARLRCGQALPAPDHDGRVAVFVGEELRLIGFAEGGLLRPKTVLAG